MDRGEVGRGWIYEIAALQPPLLTALLPTLLRRFCPQQVVVLLNLCTLIYNLIDLCPRFFFFPYAASFFFLSTISNHFNSFLIDRKVNIFRSINTFHPSIIGIGNGKVEKVILKGRLSRERVESIFAVVLGPCENAKRGKPFLLSRDHRVFGTALSQISLERVKLINHEIDEPSFLSSKIP